MSFPTPPPQPAPFQQQPPQQPPMPGLIPPRPSNFGEIFSGTFMALRRAPGVMIGAAILIPLLAGIAAAIVAFVIVLAGFLIGVSAASVGSSPPAWFLVLLGIVLLIVVLIAMIAGAALQGIVTENTRDLILGTRAKVSELWQRSRHALWRLAGLALIQLAIVLGILAVVALVIIVPLAAGAGSNVAGTITTVLVGILLGLASLPLLAWISTKIAVAPSIVVIEGVGPIEAIGRSWQLTKGRFWATFGPIFVVGTIVGMAGYIVSLPGGFASAFQDLDTFSGPNSNFGGLALGAVFVTFLFQVLASLVQSVGTALQVTVGTLLYTDLRMHKEGLGMSLQSFIQARANGVPPTQLVDPFARVSPAPTAMTPPMGGMHPGAGMPPTAATPPAAQNWAPPAPAGPPAAQPYQQPTQPIQPPVQQPPMQQPPVQQPPVQQPPVPPVQPTPPPADPEIPIPPG